MIKSKCRKRLDSTDSANTSPGSPDQVKLKQAKPLY